MDKKPHLILVSFLLITLGLAACSRVQSLINPGGNITPTVNSSATQPPTMSAEDSNTPPPEPTTTPTGTKGTITIWHSWDEPEIPALLQLIRDFQQQYPDVLFDVLYIPMDDLQARYEEAARQGGGPTILLGPDKWGPSLYDAGLIADLNNLANPDLLKPLAMPALDDARYKGTLIGLPYAMQGVVLFRNPEIITSPPATFDDLINQAKTATQGEIVGAYLERSFFYSGANLNGIGGSLMDANGIPTFTDVNGQAWIGLLQEYEQAGPVDFQSDHDLEQFKAGKAGFLIDGTWNMSTLSQTLGEGKLAIDPWPSYRNGYLSGYVQTQNLYLSTQATGDNRATSWNFIQYLISQSAQSILATSGKIPVASGFPISDPLIAQAAAALAGGTAYPITPEIDNYSVNLDIALKSIFNDKIPPAVALQTAQQSILSALSGAQPVATPPTIATSATSTNTVTSTVPISP